MINGGFAKQDTAVGLMPSTRGIMGGGGRDKPGRKRPGKRQKKMLNEL